MNTVEKPPFSITHKWTMVNENSRLLSFDLGIPNHLVNQIQPIYLIKSKKKSVLTFYKKTEEEHIFRTNIPFGVSLVKGEDITIVDQPDQIVYRRKGKLFSFLLSDQE